MTYTIHRGDIAINLTDAELIAAWNIVEHQHLMDDIFNRLQQLDYDENTNLFRLLKTETVEQIAKDVENHTDWMYDSYDLRGAAIDRSIRRYIRSIS